MTASKAGPKIVKTTRLALRLAWDASPLGLCFVALLAIVTAFPQLLTASLGRRFVNLVATGEATSTGSVMVGVGLGLSHASARLASALQQTARYLFGQRVSLHTERFYCERALTLDVARYEDPEWHDRMERARSAVTSRTATVTQALVGSLGNLVTIVGMLGLLAQVGGGVMILAGLAAVPSFLAQRWVSRMNHTHFSQEVRLQRLRQYLVILMSYPEPGLIKEVRAYGLKRHLLDEHSAITREIYLGHRTLYLRALRLQAVASGLTGVFLGVAYASVARMPDLSPGDVALLVVAIGTILGSLSSIGGSFGQIHEDSLFLSDYFAFADATPLVAEPSNALDLPDGRLGIELDGVWFSYPNGSVVLRGCELTIEPGELVALIGANGAGKSTLIKLMLRFYDPDEGAVRVGGVDLRRVATTALRRKAAVLFQDFARYDFPVRDNVRLGDIDREAIDDDLWRALRAGAADQVVERVGGLDARVGRLFDGAQDLSGGEWQRLAVSRALFRNAEIWILDEPTASLDPDAERRVVTNFRRMLAGRTGIIVSHRMSSVRDADRIIVLENGRVVESGSHDELIQLGGEYARLSALQSSGSQQ